MAHSMKCVSYISFPKHHHSSESDRVRLRYDEKRHIATVGEQARTPCRPRRPRRRWATRSATASSSCRPTTPGRWTTPRSRGFWKRDICARSRGTALASQFRREVRWFLSVGETVSGEDNSECSIMTRFVLESIEPFIVRIAPEATEFQSRL